MVYQNFAFNGGYPFSTSIRVLFLIASSLHLITSVTASRSLLYVFNLYLNLVSYESQYFIKKWDSYGTQVGVIWELLYFFYEHFTEQTKLSYTPIYQNLKLKFNWATGIKRKPFELFSIIAAFRSLSVNDLSPIALTVGGCR